MYPFHSPAISILTRFGRVRNLVQGTGIEPACSSEPRGYGPLPYRYGFPCTSWRKVEESNPAGSSPTPGFRDQLPTIQQHLPNFWRRVRDSNSLALAVRRFSKPVRHSNSADSPWWGRSASNRHATHFEGARYSNSLHVPDNLVGQVGIEPTNSLQSECSAFSSLTTGPKLYGGQSGLRTRKR